MSPRRPNRQVFVGAVPLGGGEETAEATRDYCRVIESCEDYRGRVELACKCLATLGKMMDAVLRLPMVEPDEQTRIVLSSISDEPHLKPLKDTPKTLKGSVLRKWIADQKRWLSMRRRRRTMVLRRYPSAFRRLRRTDVPVEEFFRQAQRLRTCFGTSDRYRIVFDPYTDRELSKSNLSNDLAEIWHDVKATLLVYDVGTKRERRHAIHDWRSAFVIHWGRHAGWAMLALWSIAGCEGWDDECLPSLDGDEANEPPAPP